MQRSNLLESLKLFKDSRFLTEEEHSDYAKLVEFVQNNPGCFEREHLGHITGSVWIINHEETHALLTHHRKLNIWLQLGGHAYGDPDIPAVALKEAYEESGIENLEFIFPEIYDIDIHPIPNHKCVAHYDVRYLLKAGPGATYIVSEESHDLAWVPFEKIPDYTTAPSVVRMADKMMLIR